MKKKNTSIHFVYINTKNKAEAKKIGKELLKCRLAACINIFDSMNSLYWWKGKIREDHETVLIVKTTNKLVEKIITKVAKIHSYDCPCILSFSIAKGNAGYIRWLMEETK